MSKSTAFVGMDVHAETIAVAVAEGRDLVRSLGTIPNRPEAVRRLIGNRDGRQPGSAQQLARPNDDAGTSTTRPADAVARSTWKSASRHQQPVEIDRSPSLSAKLEKNIANPEKIKPLTIRLVGGLSSS